MGDFELHLSTVFPEVRMKQYIEVRGADAGSRQMTCSRCPRCGRVCCTRVRRQGAREIMVSTSPEEHRRCFEVVHREGLRAETDVRLLPGDGAGSSWRCHAPGLDEIAEREGHASEAPFLAPLEQIVDTGRTQADRLLEDFERLEGQRMELVGAHEL